MVPKWVLAIRGRVPRAAGIVLGLVPIALLLLIWWFVTRGEYVEDRIIGPAILPSPGEVFGVKSIKVLVQDRDLVKNALISLRRVCLGYLVAVGVVLPLGIVMGAFGLTRAMFTPMTTASGYIPIAALVPLTMAWFGIGEYQKVMFLALAFAIYLLPMVVVAIDSVPDVYVRTAQTLGAGRAATVFRVLIPVALPAIWHGMRLAFGIGWTYLVLTEVISMEEGGLGALIAISQRRGPREHIYLVIIAITLIAWVVDLGWDRLGRLLFPYRRTAK